MALFKKMTVKKKTVNKKTVRGDNGYAPIPLLGDGTGSPWYAKGQAYRGDPMDASTDRVEAAPEPSYEPAYEVPDEPGPAHGSHA